MVLRVEQLPRRHRDDARLGPALREQLGRVGGEADLGTGRDQDQVDAAVGLTQDICAARDVGVARAQERQLLAREDDDGRPGLRLHRELPGLERFERVGRPDVDDVGRRADHRELLDRLVRRAVFAQEHRVVGEDEDFADLVERGQPQRAA